MTDHERPGWAEPVPRETPDRRYVCCGGCGRSMSWREFLRHGPECTGRQEAA